MYRTMRFDFWRRRITCASVFKTGRWTSDGSILTATSSPLTISTAEKISPKIIIKIHGSLMLDETAKHTYQRHQHLSVFELSNDFLILLKWATTPCFVPGSLLLLFKCFVCTRSDNFSKILQEFAAVCNILFCCGECRPEIIVLQIQRCSFFFNYFLLEEIFCLLLFKKSPLTRLKKPKFRSTATSVRCVV